MHLLYVPAGARDHYLINALHEIGHVIDAAEEVEDGVAQAAVGAFDAVLLHQPRVGLQVVAAFAAAQQGAVVFVLLDEAAADEATAALRAGADGCMARPFHIQEVHERLLALIRLGDRMRLNPQAQLALERLRSQRAFVTAAGRAPLSPREIQVMAYLMRREGQVVSAELIGRSVWGDGAEPNPERVRTALTRLRRKLQGALGHPFIHTAAGHGWVFRQGG